MNSRLIPWCLAATAFVVSLALSGWRDDLGDRDQPTPRHAAPGARSTLLTTDHPGWHSSQATVAAPSAALERVPGTQILPLPSATRPELDSEAQPVPDDEPTVDDLPGRSDPSAFTPVSH